MLQDNVLAEPGAAHSAEASSSDTGVESAIVTIVSVVVSDGSFVVVCDSHVCPSMCMPASCKQRRYSEVII
jgi:hypothetical protein